MAHKFKTSSSISVISYQLSVISYQLSVSFVVSFRFRLKSINIEMGAAVGLNGHRVYSRLVHHL
ncbi:hypothetical protein CUU45_00070 [Pectobacterium polaris]|nr:hypothetical protein [Pectobacterium polaris]